MAELVSIKKLTPRTRPRQTFDSEADVKEEVKRVLAEFGELCYSLMPSSSAFGTNEKHDFHIVLNGRGGTIETKFGKNPMTEGQQRCYKKVRNAGGFSFLIDETNVLGLKDALVTACNVRL